MQNIISPFQRWKEKNINKLTTLAQNTKIDQKHGFSLPLYVLKVWQKEQPNRKTEKERSPQLPKIIERIPKNKTITYAFKFKNMWGTHRAEVIANGEKAALDILHNKILSPGLRKTVLTTEIMYK